jgi:hypothetical protein
MPTEAKTLAAHARPRLWAAHLRGEPPLVGDTAARAGRAESIVGPSVLVRDLLLGFDAEVDPTA